MESIFRFQVKRQVELLRKSRTDQLALHTHPAGHHSNWYQDVEKLCQERDYPGLTTLILEFLQSDRAIHSYEQVDTHVARVAAFFRDNGPVRTAGDQQALLKASDFGYFRDYFSDPNGEAQCEDAPELDQAPPRNSPAMSDFQNVADTLLALSVLGKLGHRENLDYLLLFKALHICKLLNLRKTETTPAEINALFDKQVALPPCFFQLNPCTKKLEPALQGSPFAHLGIDEVFEKEKRGLRKNIIVGDRNFRVDHDCQCKEKEEDCECCHCECDTSCKDQNPCCAEIRPFITDLMVVRQELTCYEAHHLAYNETIMLGEQRTRAHRHLERTEDFSERETFVSKSEEKDHQVSERFSLQTESQKTIESDIAIEAGVTINTWGPTYDSTTSLNANAQFARSESNRIARDRATDVTERTVRKIQETVRELTSKTRLVETEETNTHVFDNTQANNAGQKHINGMYHFINSKYKGQVMNYGKRLMFEFILPEPLQLYKKLLSGEPPGFDLPEPVQPDLNITDINRSNYLSLAEQYQLKNIAPPPDEFQYVEFFVESDDQDTGWQWDHSISIVVPEGYYAESFSARGIVGWPNNGGVSVLIQILNGFLTSRPSDNNAFNGGNISLQQGGVLPVRVQYWDVERIAIKVIVRCKLREELFEEWQMDIYEKIMGAYAAERQEYEAALARYESARSRPQEFGRNPFLNRETERNELKRMAISYISCQFYDSFSAMKRNVKPCGYPQMDLEQARDEGKFIQFFEQLFDWNLMTYLFYPYYWGQKCDWPEKMQHDTGDPLFDKALMAGAARVQVPVRAGHEPLAMHWVSFGEIWEGRSEPPVPGSSYYISMAQEIKEEKGVYYADREGVLSVTQGSTTVVLTGSSYYWDSIAGTNDQLKIDNDLDREIIIDCIVYRILSIDRDLTDPTNETWTIELDRPYEEATAQNHKWSTGAVFVGAPFEISIPTNLVYLRNTKDPVSGEYVIADCLPCGFPIKCE